MKNTFIQALSKATKNDPQISKMFKKAAYTNRVEQVKAAEERMMKDAEEREKEINERIRLIAETNQKKNVFSWRISGKYFVYYGIMFAEEEEEVKEAVKIRFLNSSSHWKHVEYTLDVSKINTCNEFHFLGSYVE